VHLAHLRLRDFRNYARLDLDFSPGLHVLCGRNAQGKTNILESIYFMATLRSFRGVGVAQIIRHGQTGLFIGGSVVNPSQHQVKIYCVPRERKLSLDGKPVRRYSNYLGVLRVVIFCAEDMQLIKGSAHSRRRFWDLLLTQTNPTYLPLLQRYTRALRSRNALLKQYPIDRITLESYTQELVNVGSQIMKFRSALTPRLSPLARLAYRRISHNAEELRLQYDPSIKEDFAAELAKSHPRELKTRATILGPHRDDIEILLDNHSANKYASEGQKRSLAIAFKMAQAEYLTGIHNAPPVLLIDDVMGELDIERRSGLLPLLSRTNNAQGQVFMTCTEENWPREINAQYTRWDVSNGKLQQNQ
jgi:DNA replication and repair protein RecF